MSLPYFRSRRYLTGVDWLMGAMDHLARRTTGIGAISQAILEVAGKIDRTHLSNAIDEVSARFPLLRGRVARDVFNLAPFWEVAASSVGRRIALEVVELAEGDDTQARQLLNDHANRPLSSRFEHVRFLLVCLGNSRSLLGMVFDHKLFDAFGAETFLRLLDQAWQGKLEEIAPLVKQTEPAHLDNWSKRFAAGKLVNERLFELAQKKIVGLKMPLAGGHGRVKFLHEKLSIEQTQSVRQMAMNECGMPILLPSTAARAVLAMRSAVPKPPLIGEQYLIFTSASTRSPTQSWESLFFNHLSFLLFGVENDPALTASEIAVRLRDDFFAQMRQGLTAAFTDASMLMRICPHVIGSRAMSRFFGGRLCSLYFACLQSSGFSQETFMGLHATDLIHTPTAFSPPGLNLCMTFFAGRFNIVLSYLDGAMSDEQAAEMMSAFKTSLAG